MTLKWPRKVVGWRGSFPDPAPFLDAREKMQEKFAIAGIVCLIGAIVGGGLSAFGVQLPLVASGKRQAMLGLLGLLFLAVAYLPPAASASDTRAQSTPDSGRVARSPGNDSPTVNSRELSLDDQTQLLGWIESGCIPFQWDKGVPLLPPLYLSRIREKLGMTVGDAEIKVIGYTEQGTSEAYGARVAEARARSVARRLTEMGYRSTIETRPLEASVRR